MWVVAKCGAYLLPTYSCSLRQSHRLHHRVVWHPVANRLPCGEDNTVACCDHPMCSFRAQALSRFMGLTNMGGKTSLLYYVDIAGCSRHGSWALSVHKCACARCWGRQMDRHLSEERGASSVEMVFWETLGWVTIGACKNWWTWLLLESV